MKHSITTAITAGVLLFGLTVTASAQSAGGRGGPSSFSSTLQTTTCSVKSVDASASTFDCSGKTYGVTSNTTITIGGTASSLSALQTGSKATVTYSSGSSGYVASSVTQ